MVLQPQILLHLAGILGITALFYFLIPGIGAFYIRSSWRKFRKLLADSALYPPLNYAALRETEKSEDSPGRIYRFFGHLQAMQGDSEVWVSDGKVSVNAKLEHVHEYILSVGSSWNNSEFREYPVQPPRRVLWEKISSLPEYTHMFISGKIEWEQKKGVFKDSVDIPLLVIIYEGEKKNVLIRAMWSGRQKNEYWNPFTPRSPALGSFSLFIYFYVLLGFPQLLLPALIALSLSLIPVVPLLPPAVIFYYYYRTFWKRGRVLRAQRDLIRIPLIHFDKENSSLRDSSVLATGEVYSMRRFDNLDQIFDMADSDSLHLIQPALPKQLMEKEYYLFSNEKLQRPRDPLAEIMVVPGKPFALVEECQKRAMKYELFGLSILAIGIVLTELILFIFFSYVLV